MITIFNTDNAQPEAKLDAAFLDTNCHDYDRLFTMPRTTNDELTLMEMGDLAMGGPLNPEIAADELFKRLITHLEDDDVAIAALTALHVVHYQDCYDLAKEQGGHNAD